MQKYWFTIYDYAKEGWSFPRLMTEFEARREKMGVRYWLAHGVPEPVLAKYVDGSWQYV